MTMVSGGTEQTVSLFPGISLATYCSPEQVSFKGLFQKEQLVQNTG